MADVQLSTLGAVIKAAYEGEADTNALTDALLAILNSALQSADINTLAELNTIVTDATLGDSGDFATAAQGVKADTATQPADFISTFINDSDYVTALLSKTFTATDQAAFEIDVNAAGFADIKALGIDYVTGAIAPAAADGVILVNIDESLAVGGEIYAFEVLSTEEGSDSVIALKTGANIAPISHDSGAFVNMGSALNVAVDVLAELSAGGAGNVSAFVADNDTITIGDAAKFDELEVILGTGASGSGIAPTFEYSTGAGTWAAFTPTDGTNGLRVTGAVLWGSLDLVGWAIGTGSEYLIRITRTKNSVTTTPIIDKIQISASTVYSWDKDGDLIVNSVSVPEGRLSAVESITIAVSDETTPLTAGVAKVAFRMPYALTLTEVRASVTTAPTGSVLTVDINEAGVSVLSTKVTIDATESTSVTAAIPPVISDAVLADNAEITIDLDTVGSTVAGTGLKVYLIGHQV